MIQWCCNCDVINFIRVMAVLDPLKVVITNLRDDQVKNVFVI